MKRKSTSYKNKNFMLHRRSVYYNILGVVISMNPPIYKIKMLIKVGQFALPQ